MGKIQVMPESLANQIAAGEVVERPASCVKELIENSLDAGARHISVSLEEGGISLIAVQDDGVGMDEEDAKLAFARHATSKLIHPRDLFRINTLGFRGEALASISAIARVRLQTRTVDSSAGVHLSVEGSTDVLTQDPVGMPPGTRIEVRDLFFNTPARLKYLRTVATEQARCLEVVQRVALGRPDVAFRCDINGHTTFRTSGRGDVREVLAELYGVGEARQMIHVVGETHDYRISGFIGRPTQSKASRSHGHLFINHRTIRNIAVHQAVVAGYHNRLMVNRHPVYALFIEMDPTLVDVNIHPHKAEVRFSEERDLVQLVQASVRSALDEAFLVPTVHLPGHQGANSEVTRSSQTDLGLSPRKPVGQDQQNSVRAPLQARDRNVHYGSSRQTFDRKPTSSIPADHIREVLAPTAPTTQVTADALEGNTLPPALTAEAAASVEPLTEGRRATWRLRPIGQALGMYIVADDGEALYIIDQHAAHERVLFERFSIQMSQREVGFLQLLTPLTLQLSVDEHTQLFSKHALLAEMGLQFEDFGGRDVLLRTVPSIWEGLDYAVLAEDLVQSLTGVGNGRDTREVLRDRIVTRACKAAIKANEYLSEMEVKALCDAMSDLEDPFHCPHGRPVFIRLQSRDLEKEFKRIV